MNQKDMDMLQDRLEKLHLIGLKYPIYSSRLKSHIFRFQVAAQLSPGQWKENITEVLVDLIKLCEDYITKLEETK